jgi:hypothetical protein
MAHCTFSVKFMYDTQFIFGSLMFAVKEDGNLELLTQGPAPRHSTPVYGIAPSYPVDPSTSGGACSGMNPHVGPYYFSAMTSQWHLIGKTIFQSSLEHQAPHLREQLPIGTPLKTTWRSGIAPVRTLPSKFVTSAWWGQPGATLRIALVGTRP